MFTQPRRVTIPRAKWFNSIALIPFYPFRDGIDENDLGAFNTDNDEESGLPPVQ
jgi:hypothetical protein